MRESGLSRGRHALVGTIVSGGIMSSVMKAASSAFARASWDTFQVMQRRLQGFALCLIVAAAAGCGTSGAVERGPLWPGEAPGARGERKGDRPEVHLFLPDPARQHGGALVVAAGGSYGHQIGLPKEGFETARWYRERGFVVLVVRYRVGQSGYNHVAFLQDGQRAVRTLRSRAEELGIDPGRIGMVGYSAAGHLAAWTAMECIGDAGRSAPVDAIDRVSCELAFAVSVYPVITLDLQYAHRRSRNNLLRGIAKPSAELIAHLSLENRVTSGTPPILLVTTKKDTKVDPQNAVLLYEAMKSAERPTELFLYDDGRHGVGVAQKPEKMPHMSQWPCASLDWLFAHEFVPEAATCPPESSAEERASVPK